MGEGESGAPVVGVDCCNIALQGHLWGWSIDRTVKSSFSATYSYIPATSPRHLAPPPRTALAHTNPNPFLSLLAPSQSPCQVYHAGPEPDEEAGGSREPEPAFEADPDSTSESGWKGREGRRGGLSHSEVFLSC